MSRKISFINYKGGVGKTSLIVNIASCLAESGKRVLLVDLDAQSNSSIWLLRLERWNPLVDENEGHLYSVFNPGVKRVKDCIVRDVVSREDSKDVLLPRLDLLPTTFNLVDLEENFDPEAPRPAYVIFQEQLSEIEADYDFILFDCPPNVLSASRCGIFSSDEIYVPSNPDALSLIGFTLLAEKLKQFYEESAPLRLAAEMGPNPEIRGAIFNSITPGSDTTGARMRTQVRMNQLKGKGVVAMEMKIFRSAVRDAAIVPRSVTLGLPVCAIDYSGDDETVRDDYRRVTEELLKSAPEVVDEGVFGKSDLKLDCSS